MRERYTVEVQLRSGAKLICFDANALAAVEKELGKKVMAILRGDPETVTERLGFVEIRAFLWAGLRCVRGASGGPAWSLDRVGDEMIVDQTAQYLTQVVRAINLALTGEAEPKVSAEDPTMGANQQTSTGDASR